MTKLYKFMSGCYRKIRYRNGASAENHARRMNLKKYKCPFCNGWHVGH